MDAARLACLNIAGTCLGGFQTRIGKLHVELAKELGAGQERATIIGDGARVSVPAAAYANANLGFALDYAADVVDYAGRATGGDGAAFTDEYLRLFMLPGVGHCRGGVGPDQANWMAALAGWVEKGQKPATITATATLKQDGENVTGSIETPQGVAEMKGTYKGKALAMAFTIQSPQGAIDIKVNGEVDGTSMKGIIDFGMGMADFTAKKK